MFVGVKGPPQTSGAGTLLIAGPKVNKPHPSVVSAAPPFILCQHDVQDLAHAFKMVTHGRRRHLGVTGAQRRHYRPVVGVSALRTVNVRTVWRRLSSNRSAMLS